MRNAWLVTVLLVTSLTRASAQTSQGQTVQPGQGQTSLQLPVNWKPAREDALALEREARHLRNTGIVLAGIGAALGTIALTLAAEGIYVHFTQRGPSPWDETTFFGGAAIFGLGGALMLGVGIPTWVVGARQMRAARLQIEPRLAGTSAGLVIRF